MNASEIRAMSRSDLEGRVSELRKELFQLKMQSAVEGRGLPPRSRVIRRTIARILTCLSQN